MYKNKMTTTIVICAKKSKIVLHSFFGQELFVQGRITLFQFVYQVDLHFGERKWTNFQKPVQMLNSNHGHWFTAFTIV